VRYGNEIEIIEELLANKQLLEKAKENEVPLGQRILCCHTTSFGEPSRDGQQQQDLIALPPDINSRLHVLGYFWSQDGRALHVDCAPLSISHLEWTHERL
jgi:hypothetical protein